MQNTKPLLTSIVLTGLLALGGCSFFPGVYKIDIQQGNVITQDMINQLRPGMTQRQVRFIMGNALITDTFHPNRWDYYYSFKPANRPAITKHVILTFNDQGLLEGLSGDYRPGMSQDEAILGQPEGRDAPVQPAAVAPAPAAITQPSAAPATTPDQALKTIQNDVDSVKTEPAATPAASSN